MGDNSAALLMKMYTKFDMIDLPCQHNSLTKTLPKIANSVFVCELYFTRCIQLCWMRKEDKDMRLKMKC